MEILVGIIWIVIGMMYIIYRGVKEEPKTAMYFITIVGILMCQPIIMLICCFGGDQSEWVGFITVISWAIEIPIIVIAIDNKNGFYSKRKAERISNEKETRMKNILSELAVEGYNIRKFFQIRYNQKMKKYELDDIGVLNGIRAMNLYNQNEDCLLTTQEIYEKCCQEQKKVLDLCDENTLSKMLGVDLAAVPLNSRVDNTSVRLRRVMVARSKQGNTDFAASLAATSFVATSDIEDERRRQRKQLLIKMNLEKIGLRYPCQDRGDLPNDSYVYEVINAISKFTATKQRLKTELESMGIRLNEENLNRIVCDPKSPLNSVYNNTPVSELYNWICMTRTREVCMLYRHPLISQNSFREDFEKKTGLKLTEIPPPNTKKLSDADDIRAACAIQYYLKNFEGINADYDFLTCSECFSFGLNKDLLDEFELYKPIFLNIVDTNL